MRNYLLSLLSCAALLMACQPVTPIPVKTKSPSPNLKIKEATPIPHALIAPPLPQVPLVASMPAETLSSDTGNQNDNQTEIDLAISTVTKSNETQTNSAQASPDTTPKAVTMTKTFDPTQIIGFATPILVHNLGKANMVRKEGPMEVWQYQFGSCVVDFFFYPIGKGSSQLILKTWDMRSTIMGDSLDRSRCHDQMNLYHQKFLSSS
jgi:hypothetical protein